MKINKNKQILRYKREKRISFSCHYVKFNMALKREKTPISKWTEPIEATQKLKTNRKAALIVVSSGETYFIFNILFIHFIVSLFYFVLNGQFKFSDWCKNNENFINCITKSNSKWRETLTSAGSVLTVVGLKHLWKTAFKLEKIS